MMTHILGGLVNECIQLLFRDVFGPRSRAVDTFHQPLPAVFSLPGSWRFMGGVSLNADGFLFLKRAAEEILQGMAYGR